MKQQNSKSDSGLVLKLTYNQWRTTLTRSIGITFVAIFFYIYMSLTKFRLEHITVQPSENQLKYIKISQMEDEMSQVDKESSAGLTENSTKLILFWSLKYGTEFKDQNQVGTRMFEKCEYSNCKLIADRNRIAEASMLVFFNYDNPNFPVVRYQNQLYSHMIRDPPREWNNTHIDLYDDQINITNNYRPDSDIPSENVKIVLKDQPGPIPYVPRIPLKNKTRSVAWAVSHCITPSKREDYVKELSKYIDVDIYGRCGSNTCSKELGMECFEMFEQKYKFYLSFENRYCKMYVSEKFKHPMEYELVPIVMGMWNYAELAPPHSYINIQDFNSPKELAEFLHRLSDNEEEYQKYFAWKPYYDVYRPGGDYCGYCKVLHSSAYMRGEPILPVYKRLGMTYKAWWQQVCDNDITDRILSNI